MEKNYTWRRECPQHQVVYHWKKIQNYLSMYNYSITVRFRSIWWRLREIENLTSWRSRHFTYTLEASFSQTLSLSPGAPPAPVRLSGQKIFEEKFSPFQWTGRWKFATNGGSSQHFYRRLNALKTARIESREDSKTLTVAEIGKNGVFFVKRARCNPRFSH